MALSTSLLRTAIKPALLSSCLMAVLGFSSAALADDNSMQMLPPTFAPDPNTYNQLVTPCTGVNKLLFFSGTTQKDYKGNSYSAINCSTNAPTIDSSSGDLWLGSTLNTGDSWTKGTPEHGPALHMSSATGYNSDDIYFQRFNDAADVSELRLVVGDNAQSTYTGANGAGDAFVIGALDSGNGYVWTPRFVFTGLGKLGVGTTHPTNTLSVEGVDTFNGYSTWGTQVAVTNDLPTSAAGLTSINDSNNNTSLFMWGSQSGSSLYQGQAALETSNSNLIITTDMSKPTGGSHQINLVTGGWTNNPTMTITAGNPGNVGMGTTTPQGSLDIENATQTATACLNGGCVKTFHPVMTEVVGVTAMATSNNNWQQNQTAVTTRAHDFCVISADQHNSLDSNCEMYPSSGNPGFWTLEADAGIAGSNQGGQTNCQMMCFDFN